jgi:CDP-2,3-bis-(O-geranylgeranyl)-sn-glycerol synthase
MLNEVVSFVTLIPVTVWLLLPIYTPNNFAVLLGGGKPLDFGKNFFDGRRILGNGKTIRGFVAGVSGGIFVGNLQYIAEVITNYRVYSTLEYESFVSLVSLLAFGAMFGDSVGSFLKRRFGVESGEKFPVVDQLTFLIVGLAISSFHPSFWQVFDFQKIIVGILITPFLHILTNYLAFKLKLKSVPW